MPSNNKSSFSYEHVTATRDTTYNYGGNVDQTSTKVVPKKFNIRYMQGTTISNFRKRQKAGELLPHTKFLQYECTGDSSGGGYITQTYDNGDKAEKTYTDYLHPYKKANVWSGVAVPDFWTDLETAKSYVNQDLGLELIQQSAASIADGKLDGLTFLAELHKVRRLFSGALRKLLSLGPLTGKVKSIPGAWLEYRYGWRPLLRDIEGINDALANFDDKRSRFSERNGFSTSISLDANLPTQGYSFATHISSESIRKVRVSYRGSVTADIAAPNVKFNVIDTAWELVPYSFVIDWFLDIGTALSAISFLGLSTAHSSSFGYDLSIITEGEQSIGGFVQTQPQSAGNLSYSFNEQCSVQERIPLPVSNLPQASLSLDAFQITDLLALMIQRFR